MRDRLQTAFAVVVGVLLVGTATLGGVAGPGSSPVGTASAQPLAGCEVAQFGPVVVSDITGLFCNNPDADKLAGLDAQETKQNIYDQASIQKQNNQLTNTAYANYLNDTQSIALMEGKNAYIRALENGSAESVARNKAKTAVASYYAVKQRNLVSAWNTTVLLGESMRNVAANTTGVDSSFVSGEASDGFVGFNRTPGNGGLDRISSHQLVNASSVDVMTVKVKVSSQSGNVNFIHPTADEGFSSSSGTVYSLFVEPPNSNFDRLTFADVTAMHERWSEIQAQNEEVQASLDDFVNATYDSYQQGEINASTLVDPYLGARSYDPRNSSTWTLRTLSSMGISPPENLSNVGRMNVSVNGVTYTGTLMSDGTPTDGYKVGGTYDASNITGAQFVALDGGGSRELTGEFTLESVTTADGTELAQNETVTYKTINYQTANTSEFKALQEELDKLSAELNAKQQQERNAGGGGILDGFQLGGVGTPTVVLVAVGATLFLLGRN